MTPIEKRVNVSTLWGIHWYHLSLAVPARSHMTSRRVPRTMLSLGVLRFSELRQCDRDFTDRSNRSALSAKRIETPVHTMSTLRKDFPTTKY